jgi:hypothetical protein
MVSRMQKALGSPPDPSHPQEVIRVPQRGWST